MEDQSVCVHAPGNIGPRGSLLRGLVGVVALAIAGAGAAYLRTPGMSRWWRLALFVPLFVGVLTLLQAREKT